MELDEVLKIRRSNRRFKKTKISTKKLNYLLESARVAPSAANRQPWHFVVLTNRRHEITQIMRNKIKQSNQIIKDKNIATANYNAAASVNESIQIIDNAPVLILVFRKNDPTWLEGDYLSIGCACEHICLAAANINLGSVWLRDVIYTRYDIVKHLKLKNMELVTGLAIGYPKEENWRAKKKNLNDIVEWLN